MKKVGYIGFVIILLGSSIIFARGKEETSPAFEDINPQILIPTGHLYIVTSAAFSPDERYLASGSGDRTKELNHEKSSNEKTDPNRDESEGSGGSSTHLHCVSCCFIVPRGMFHPTDCI